MKFEENKSSVDRLLRLKYELLSKPLLSRLHLLGDIQNSEKRLSADELEDLLVLMMIEIPDSLANRVAHSKIDEFLEIKTDGGIDGPN